MRLAEQLSKTDRAIGIGGLTLAIVALASTTQRIEVSGDAEVVPAIVGASMVLWVLLATVRHHRAHRGGRGRGWLIAGWVVLGINLVWSLFQALDTSAFDDGFWHGLKEFATGPPIMMVLVPLVLSSIAILRDGADPPPTDISLDSDGPSRALKVPGQATDEAAIFNPIRAGGLSAGQTAGCRLPAGVLFAHPGSPRRARGGPGAQTARARSQGDPQECRGRTLKKIRVRRGVR